MICPVRSSLLQKDTSGLRLSWFHGEEGDIYLWKDSSGRRTQFLLTFCHRMEQRERFVEWRRDRLGCGFVASRETAKIVSGPDIASPILVYEKPLNRSSAQARDFLKSHGKALDSKDRLWIESKLRR